MNNSMPILAQQSKLNALVTDSMREQIKTLKEVKEVPKKEMDKVKEDIAKVEEDFARYINREMDFRTKVDTIISKVL
jgi:hypothetical protein